LDRPMHHRSSAVASSYVHAGLPNAAAPGKIDFGRLAKRVLQKRFIAVNPLERSGCP
jgi:hypothetical protein